MSGGTPVGSASMRQRHSQGYFSGNEDLEDDASSRMCRTPPPIPRARTWIEVMENVLWLASAAFIFYFGDRNSNFIYVLWKDERIKRIALYLGLLCTLLNLVVILFTTLFSWDVRRVDEKLELLNPSTAPIITLLGLLSFCFSLYSWLSWLCYRTCRPGHSILKLKYFALIDFSRMSSIVEICLRKWRGAIHQKHASGTLLS